MAVRSLVKNLAPVTYSVSHAMGGWWNVIKEPFAGAWQRNCEIESRPNLLAFAAVYACVRLISSDISKLRLRLVERDPDLGIWEEVRDLRVPFLAVIRKPNPYQTRIQFLSLWVVTKLLFGNAYIMKVRDRRGIVVQLYVLDPRYVTVLVADDGSVLYRLSQDVLNGVPQPLLNLPASEVIHDRCMALFHPLVGVGPIYACGASATQGIKIQANSSVFFDNMSRPSGQLTAPTAIDDETANRLKRDFEENFSGGKLGRLLVAGGGLKYEAMTIPAVDAQLIEQLRFTGEDVARAFGVPPYKIGLGANPTFQNIGAMNQDYYTQTLQAMIEEIELLLDEGLGLVDVIGHEYGTELDVESLLRMDPLGRADRNAKEIGAGYLKPNEARASENRPPVAGGDQCFMQKQNWPLGLLGDDATPPKPPAPPPGAPAPEGEPPEAGEEAEADEEAAAEEAAAAKFLRGLVVSLEEGLTHD
jgi:HK97 family phage portal protein